MIGVVDVEIQAANPNMPLYPLRAYVNSPSSIRLRNVPRRIGSWQITAVQLVAAYPDGSIVSAECILTGGVWVGTIAASGGTGTSENGYTVYANGTDENGNPVTGYVLGKGLVEILDTDGSVTPGVTTNYLHLLAPNATPTKDGDVWRTTSDEAYNLRQGGQNYKLKGLLPTDSLAWSQVSGKPSCAVEDVPAKFTMNTLAAKMNELLAWARTTFAALALVLLPFSASGALTVQTAPLGDIPSDSGVVTNVYMEGGTTGLSTNDVCNIVTNEVDVGLGEWQYNVPVVMYIEPRADDAYTFFCRASVNGGEAKSYWGYNQQGTSIENTREIRWFESDPSDIVFISTRADVTRNALGLARLVDLPPLTNGLPALLSSACSEVARSATNYTDSATNGLLTAAAISTNNPAFVAAVTNCPVVIADIDGATLGEFGEYGTLGALLAALAAAITWLKANKADTSALPYALVDVTVTNGTATLTDRAINAVSLTADATLAFPAQTAGKARDFVVRLTLTETGNVVPSVTFPADVEYETEGGEWPDLTEAGTYIVRLTEVPKASESETARFFLQCSSAVADATPPSAGGAA